MAKRSAPRSAAVRALVEGWRPSADAAEAARLGLLLYADGRGGKGLRPETIEWAKRIARRATVDPGRLRIMAAWHARHAVDRRPGWAYPPTPGYVAFLLWGGLPAARYVTRVIYGRSYASQGRRGAA